MGSLVDFVIESRNQKVTRKIKILKTNVIFDPAHT